MFTSVLKGSALDWFLNNLSRDMMHSDIADAMIQQYNLPYRKAALLSEVEGIRFTTFKHTSGIESDRNALNRMIKHLDHLVPQLAADFQSGAHKTRILKNALFGLEWSITPCKSLSTAGFTYNQFVTALNESLQVQMDLYTFRGTSTRYGQLITHLRDVRRYPSSSRCSEIHTQKTGHTRVNRFERTRYRDAERKYSDRRYFSQSRKNDRNRSSLRERYESSSARNQNRMRSRSPSKDRYKQHDDRTRYNPSFSHMQCIGCGSPDHVQSDNRCTSTLNQIRTYLINANIPLHQADTMAKIYFSAKTAHNIAAARHSHIRTNPQQIGEILQEPITVEPGIDQFQSETNIEIPGNEMRYVNIANDLYDSDEKQVMFIQIYTAFVADACRSDTDSEITINCTHKQLLIRSMFRYTTRRYFV